MHTLRVLAVSFDTEIKPWELPRFRGAVARKVGLEHEWFHNHNNETGGYHQRYPLIQYKLETREGRMRPMLLCLDQGIEEAHHLFSQPDWNLRIGDRQHELRIAHLNVQQYKLNVWETPFKYRIHKWLAFNPDNYEFWRSLEGVAEQYGFLERVLSSHIIAFAAGVNWQIDRHFDLKITQGLKQEWLEHKGVKKLAFTVEFQANIQLPDFIGLGKGSGMGLGVLRVQRQPVMQS